MNDACSKCGYAWPGSESERAAMHRRCGGLCPACFVGFAAPQVQRSSERRYGATFMVVGRKRRGGRAGAA